MLTLLKGKHFKVKLLYFKEGGAISMQRHKHRDELWLWIFGDGHMLQSQDQKRASHAPRAGDYLLIEKMRWHKYIAQKPTLVLEIQTGKCSERDIERAK